MVTVDQRMVVPVSPLRDDEVDVDPSYDESSSREDDDEEDGGWGCLDIDDEASIHGAIASLTPSSPKPRSSRRASLCGPRVEIDMRNMGALSTPKPQRRNSCLAATGYQIQQDWGTWDIEDEISVVSTAESESQEGEKSRSSRRASMFGRMENPILNMSPVKKRQGVQRRSSIAAVCLQSDADWGTWDIEDEISVTSATSRTSGRDFPQRRASMMGRVESEALYVSPKKKNRSPLTRKSVTQSSDAIAEAPIPSITLRSKSSLSMSDHCMPSLLGQDDDLSFGSEEDFGARRSTRVCL